MGTVTFNDKSASPRAAKSLGLDEVGFRSGSFAFSNSYTTGGESLDLSSFLRRVDLVLFEEVSVAGATLIAYDYTNKKVKAFTAAGTEVSAATNLSTITVRFIAFGLI